MNNEAKNQGIELLRIISMLMVMTLHILGHGGVLQASKSMGTLQMLTYYSINIICFPAVDIFVLISGYVSKSHEVNIRRIIIRWLQVFFYSSVIAIIVYVVGKYDVALYGRFFENMFPVLCSKYWFFTAYFALMFISPFINISIEKMENKDLYKLFIVLIILFSFTSLLTDPFKLDSGYSFVWLLILYTTGRILKKLDILNGIQSKYLVGVIITLFVITMIPYAVIKKGILSNYVSPTIFFQAICYVVLFSRLKIRNKIINEISPFVFGSYLFQDNPILRKLVIKENMVFINSLNVALGTFVVLVLSCFFLFAGIIIEKIRIKIFRILKIDVLIDLISNKIKKMYRFS